MAESVSSAPGTLVSGVSRPGERAHATSRPRLDRMRFMAVARKEWIQLRRDPRSLGLAFIAPVVLLIIFGTAITWDVKNIRMVVVDQDRTARSRTLIESFLSSGYFKLVGGLERASEIAPTFERSAARIAIVIPPGFEAHLDAPSGSPLQVIVDGSDANTATISLGYVRAVVQAWGQRQIARGRVLNSLPRPPRPEGA